MVPSYVLLVQSVVSSGIYVLCPELCAFFFKELCKATLNESYRNIRSLYQLVSKADGLNRDNHP